MSKKTYSRPLVRPSFLAPHFELGSKLTLLELRDSQTGDAYGKMTFVHGGNSIYVDDMHVKGVRVKRASSTPGVGTLLFHHLLKWIDEKNLQGTAQEKIVRISLYAGVPKAILPVPASHPLPFYEKLGFKQVGRIVSSEEAANGELVLSMQADVEDLRKALLERLPKLYPKK